MYNLCLCLFVCLSVHQMSTAVTRALVKIEDDTAASALAALEAKAAAVGLSVTDYCHRVIHGPSSAGQSPAIEIVCEEAPLSAVGDDLRENADPLVATLWKCALKPVSSKSGEAKRDAAATPVASGQPAKPPMPVIRERLPALTTLSVSVATDTKVKEAQWAIDLMQTLQSPAFAAEHMMRNKIKTVLCSHPLGDRTVGTPVGHWCTAFEVGAHSFKSLWKAAAKIKPEMEMANFSFVFFEMGRCAAVGVTISMPVVVVESE